MSVPPVSSIAALKGRDFLLKVNPSLASPPVWVSFTGLRTTQLKINGNQVDISNKNSLGFQELLTDAGIRKYEMTCAGIYDSTVGAVFQFVEDAALENDYLDAQIVDGSGTTFTGVFVISDWTRDGPWDNAQTFSMTLTSHGPMVRSPDI